MYYDPCHHTRGPLPWICDVTLACAHRKAQTWTKKYKLDRLHGSSRVISQTNDCEAQFEKELASSLATQALNHATLARVGFRVFAVIGFVMCEKNRALPIFDF